METNFLKLYLDANKTLAKTLVIKSQTSIDAINDFLKLKHGTSAVDPYDPTSWKYYLNIAGEYHNTDTPMVVTSLDTLEDIIFSKASLLVHTATAKAYRYGSRYYYSLLAKYPEQEQLILSIVTPCDINKAIDAEDGSILSYPQYLVESQELTLIDELEGFIKRYLVRWDVKAFGLSNSLYHTAQHALLYLAVVPKLLNLRLARCHTNEAHTFHIREYLASHGNLDRYMPYMNLEQTLWLYRNIRYIERNSGKVEQFRSLVEHLLSKRRIPLNEFSVRQLAEFDADYYNQITIRRKAVNPQFNIPEKDYFDIGKLYDKERPLVYGNPLYYDNKESLTTKQLQNSNSSVLQSKDLESSMVDYNDSLPDTLEAILLRQWAYMANKGLYQAIVNFKDPKTLENRVLTAEDAFIYMVYVSLESAGIKLETLPVFINLKQRKRILPSIESLLSKTENDELSSIASRLITGQPHIVTMYSIDNFFDLCYSLYEESIYHWFLTANVHDLYRRGYISNMVSSLYEDECLILSSGNAPINEWLLSKNLPTFSYDTSQAKELIAEIFAKSTGLTVDNTKLLKNIQRALIAALSELSSYSIQFITEINQSRIVPVGWAAIRAGHLKAKAIQDQFVNVNVDLIDAKGSGSITRMIEASVNKHFDNQVIKQTASRFVDTKSNIIHYQGTHHAIDAYFYAYRITASYNLFDPVISNDSLFIGYENFLALTPAQQSQLTSIYN